VRGLPAAAGQDPGSGDHPGQVVGVGLLAHQHDRLTPRRPLHRRGGVEHRAPDRSTGRRCHPRDQHGPVGGRVELREHQLRQLRTTDPLERLVGGDELLVDELGGDPERRRRGALADPRLQHPQLAALDGELDVAQVAVVRLQPRMIRRSSACEAGSTAAKSSSDRVFRMPDTTSSPCALTR
jgi:hypothetical protein